MRGFFISVQLVVLCVMLFLSMLSESTIIKMRRPFFNSLRQKERNHSKTIKSNVEISQDGGVNRSELKDKLRRKRIVKSSVHAEERNADGAELFTKPKAVIKRQGISLRRGYQDLSKRDFYFRPVSSFGPMTDPADRRMYLMHRKERGPCFPNACHHGGLCVPRRHNFYCECLPGFIGTKCEVKRECKATTCKNGGTCTEIALGKFLCTCPVGFLGETCEERSRCHPNPCRNAGTCSETEDSYTCMCEQGYRGKDCEVINLCSPNPCKNAGICFELDNDYVCNCPQGFKGKTCEVVSECVSVYCLNGGSCRDETNGYKCVCPFGFYGKRCEASACHPNPCRNHGACLRFGNQYSCQCKQGYTGEKCEAHNPCSIGPCLNDGTCVDGTYTNSKYGFACICSPGYDGLMCEKHLPGPDDLRRTLAAI